MEKEKLYKIVFSGQIAPELTVEKVKDQFISKFKISQKKANEIFSGKNHVLKKNLTKKQALTYHEKLRKLGVISHIINDNLSGDFFSTNKNNLYICPNCNHKILNDNDHSKYNNREDCPKCGIIINKFFNKIDTENNKFNSSTDTDTDTDLDTDNKKNKLVASVKRRIMAFLFNRGLLLCIVAPMTIPYFFIMSHYGKVPAEIFIGTILTLIFCYIEIYVPINKWGITHGQEFSKIDVIDIQSKQSPSFRQLMIRSIGIIISDMTANIINIHMIFQKEPKSFSDWLSGIEQHEISGGYPSFNKSLYPILIGIALMILVYPINNNILFPEKNTKKKAKRKDNYLIALNRLADCQDSYFDKNGKYCFKPGELENYCHIMLGTLALDLNMSDLHIFQNKKGFIIRAGDRYINQDKDEIYPLKILYECQKSFFNMNGKYTSDPKELLESCFLSAPFEQIVKRSIEKNLIRIVIDHNNFEIVRKLDKRAVFLVINEKAEFKKGKIKDYKNLFG